MPRKKHVSKITPRAAPPLYRPARTPWLARLASASVLALAWSLGAHAQVAAPAPVVSQSVDPRDARIAELEARLAALEAAVMRAPPAQAAEAPARVVAPRPVADEPSDAVVAQRLAAERALERTLVRRGAVTLQPGQVEIEPSLAYVRSEQAVPVLVSIGGGASDIGRVDLRRDEATARLTARAGLPYRLQADVTLGYSAARDQERLIAGGPAGAFEREGGVLNDISLSIAHTLIASQGNGPDVLARVTYNSATGDRADNGVSFGNGFEDISAGLTAMFRQDPLVFVASADYATAFERGGIDPGDQIRVGGAALLAVSPETSLRFGVSAAVGQETVIDGNEIAGSATNAAALEIGFASVISQRALFDIGLSVGLTDDSPDYALVVSVPIRFNQFFRRG